MDFEALKAELGNRGFDYLDDDRLGLFINQAYREICNLHVWPFTFQEAFSSGSSGIVAITDVRRVLTVTRVVSDASRVPVSLLSKITYEEILEDGDDPARAGTPEYYYLRSGIVGSSGFTVVAWPTAECDLYVRYATRVVPLSDPTDLPVFDEEYHPLVVDGAAIRAYIDSDNFTAASSLRTMLDASLQAMGEDYMIETRELSYIDVGRPSDG